MKRYKLSKSFKDAVVVGSKRLIDSAEKGALLLEPPFDKFRISLTPEDNYFLFFKRSDLFPEKTGKGNVFVSWEKQKNA